MSFDPQGYPSDRDPMRPQSDPPTPAGRSRVQAPAILMIVLAVLNLAGSAYMIFNTVFTYTRTDEQLKEYQASQAEMMKRIFPDQAAQFEKQIKESSPNDMRNQSLLVGSIGTAINLVASLIMLLGGIRMLQMRSYGLCIFASVVAMIPCINLTACCCAGEAVGIWALIVLLSEDVRSSFR